MEKKVKQATTEKCNCIDNENNYISNCTLHCFFTVCIISFTYTLIGLMISSTYFKCQKDFNKIVPEELIGGKKTIHSSQNYQNTLKAQMEIHTQERSKANELRKPIPFTEGNTFFNELQI